MIFHIDPTQLSDSRIQLHWASQLLSAAADAMLEKADDDSHSNLEWDSKSNSLIGRTGCEIDVVNFELKTKSESMKLAGVTLEDAMDWLGNHLNAELKLRDYDMPDHGVANGSQWAPNLEHLSAIAEWYSFGQRILEPYGELRIWPHHFDLGFLIPGAVSSQSIGGGFAVGDEHYERPYFYINPYGLEKPDSLPEIAPGLWATSWFGAVLTASEMTPHEEAENIAKEFVANAVSKFKELQGE